jgi:hypothetical protein
VRHLLVDTGGPAPRAVVRAVCLPMSPGVTIQAPGIIGAAIGTRGP